jgi:hypothetical protein
MDLKSDQQMAKANCEACGVYGVLDRSHIKTAATGGTFVTENIILLCRADHILSHRWGWYRFCEKYPHIKDVLESKGWKFENIFGVWKLVRTK